MILVTGGTGLLGSHLLYELVKRNQPVRALYRTIQNQARTKEIFSFYETGDSAFNRIEWVKADINDYYAVCNSLHDISLVFHTAGYVTFNDREKKKLNHINTEGTANVVNACLESGRVKLCYVSSVATLGELADNLPVSESILWNQGKSASAYAKSKYMAEMEVWRGIHEGLNAFIVNPSVIIGPGMWMGPGSKLWLSVEKGLKFYPAGSTGYVDVRDVATIMIRLSELGITGERYILVAGHMKHKDLLSLLARGLNVREPYIQVTPLLSKAALLFESLGAFITHSKRRFNRRTIKIAGENLTYSNTKIRELLGVNFFPIEKSVQSAIDIYNLKKNNLNFSKFSRLHFWSSMD